MDRQKRLLADIDQRGRGLEIGALHHPVTDPTVGPVFYVDHADTATLRTKYADDDEVVDIVDVDVVWLDQPLATALASAGVAAPLDYVVASHVLEHVPNPIGWLRQVAEVLADGGVLSLALPDKRYCFDTRRAPTDLADWLDAYATDRRQPTVRTMIDFWSLILPVDSATLWADQSAYDARPILDDEAWVRATKDVDTDHYVDVHCSVFTPESFLDLCRRLVPLDLLPYRLRSFTPTTPGELEFFVSFERLPDAMDAEERRRQQSAAIGPEAERTAPPSDAVFLGLSAKEARAIAWKRAVATRLRRLGRLSGR